MPDFDKRKVYKDKNQVKISILGISMNQISL